MSNEEMFPEPPKTTRSKKKTGAKKTTAKKAAGAGKKKVKKEYVPKKKFIEFKVDGQLMREEYERAERTDGVKNMDREEFLAHRRRLAARRMKMDLYAARAKAMKSKSGKERYGGEGRGGRGTAKSPKFDRKKRFCAVPKQRTVKSRCSRNRENPDKKQIEACEQNKPRCRKTVTERLRERRQRQLARRQNKELTGLRLHVQNAYDAYLIHKDSHRLSRSERKKFIKSFRDGKFSVKDVKDAKVRAELLKHAKLAAEHRKERAEAKKKTGGQKTKKKTGGQKTKKPVKKTTKKKATGGQKNNDSPQRKSSRIASKRQN